MRLIGRLAIALVLFSAAPAFAEDSAAQGRYTIGRSPDGFVRLDTATGAASHCRLRGGVWRCDPLPVEEEAMGARLEALTVEVAKLSASLALLRSRLSEQDSSLAVPPPQASDAPKGIAQQVVARLMKLVHVLKHGRGDA
jgi:hypothetical protein